MISAPRAASDASLRLTTSAKHVSATRTIAKSTAAAAGMPGTASRLIVREMGS